MVLILINVLFRMNNNVSFILFLLLSTVFACKNSTTNNYTSTDKNKLRIISLAPSITEELIDLGVQDQIVGATSYCSISKDNDELIIGSAIEVNEEKILLLKPDIVFATSLTKQTTIDILKNNSIKVHLMKKASSFEAICENFKDLGKQIEKENEAIISINKAKKSIEELRESIPKLEYKPKVLFQISANPIATVIPNTFMNDYITYSGCENIFSDLDKFVVNRESVLVRNPDVIFITSMGFIGDQEKDNWYKYKYLNATKNKKVFIIDSNIASLPTVRNFVKTLDIVLKKLYF